ncbi:MULTISPECIES: GntR family transcriptional regulator [unclassified Treponema]|uniref:GntR family transcriptional regulator n=1 Tax=unclassified Treponema TaxID=2638727 RepID=UPI0020A54ECC|nr:MULTISPECIES: GntR family transcriptional regulator [unclassified Treponema]UTC67168.1 GntR family transcriptional regulator [Treponema sp. OMZ 789]UTC69898.1 GntR family transcriptional regulator [Treponema sp. OMZ 790]UTC72613.1 GntR family transcriptional regulator [Treponema sp. OMZ 791]
MNIFLNNSSGIPLYEQLSESIKNQILSGTLKEGEALPSMRGLAASLRVSVITTKRSYEDLAREGFLYSVPAKGYFVADVNLKKIEKSIKKNIEEKLKEICSQAKKINLNAEDLYKILRRIY